MIMTGFKVKNEKPACRSTSTDQRGEQAGKKIGAGFTLIELLVVITIVSVATSLVLVSWNNFRETRVLDAAGLELVSRLREIRSKAINGERPADDTSCPSFDGYLISQGGDGNVLVVASCDDVPMAAGETIVINPDVSRAFSGSFPIPIMIQSVSGTTSGQGFIDLSLHGLSGRLTISGSGDIKWQRT